jgi:peptidyl-prolyl cis-trans isomerase D
MHLGLSGTIHYNVKFGPTFGRTQEMAGAFENQKTGVRILFGVVIGILALSMLLYLVPQGSNTAESATDVVARVGDQKVTISDIQQQLNQIRQQSQVPPQLEGLYARQILNQMVFQKEVEYEAKRLGITVSDKERADRIKQYVPGAFNGDTFVGMDTYAREVRQRFQLTVPMFEEEVRNSLVLEKFRKLITDGISVSPAEIEDEFHNQNEKVKLDYVVIKPEDLVGKVVLDEGEIKSYYDQNKSKYQIPEKRVVRYALVDLSQIRQNTQVSDDELKIAYQENIQQYQVPNRFHAQHILLLTTGKTDAEVAEVKTKADDVLAQVKKKGTNFEDLAKKYSEDPGSKAKGGDLGWLVQGQTVPEFEKAAFDLNNGEISGLVRTQYGFHIIKLIDKERAHTKTFEEVKDSLKTPMLLQKADQQAGALADKISADIRQSNKASLDEIAQKYHLAISETAALGPNDPLLALGTSKETREQVSNLRVGELSLPVRTDRGYVVLSLKQVLPAHQGTLEEVKEKIATDLKEQKSSQQALAKASELEKRVKGGEKFDAAAKLLGLDPKNSDPLARTGSIPGVGSGKQLAGAFSLKAGDLGAPVNLGSNWIVYVIVEKTEANPADFEKQKKTITDQLLQSKRQLAWEAFRTALEERMKQEGKLKLMPEKMRGFGDFGKSNL